MSQTNGGKEKISSTKTLDEKSETNEDDCLIKYGLVSKSNEYQSKTQIKDEKNPSNDLMEEMNMLISLMIYNSFSKKYQLKSYHKNQIETNVKHPRDDLDRYDAIYSCLLNQSRLSGKNGNSLNMNLRNRFFTLKTSAKLQAFRENERDKSTRKPPRISHIPNILPFQRRCPHSNLKELKWIRDHLC